MSFRIIGLMIIIGLAVAGCNDSPTESHPHPYNYYDFVQFDTAQYILTQFRYTESVPWRYSEPVINYENSLGEPFFDLNGNGIYEAEIDSFVRALDPAVNQDLNRNNRYDGPDDPWDPWIPFDDLDGDGEYDPYPGDPFSGYIPGAPFCDYNNNGVRDTNLTSRYGAFRFVCERLEGDDFKCDLKSIYPYCSYQFTSDSGSLYTIYLEHFAISLPLMLSDSGISYKYLDMYLHILNKGTIKESVDDNYQATLFGNPITLKKSVRLTQSLTINGRTFKNLARVTFEHQDVFREFYFSAECGLLAFGKYTIDYDHYLVYYFFDRPLGYDYPIVLPMSQ